MSDSLLLRAGAGALIGAPTSQWLRFPHAQSTVPQTATGSEKVAFTPKLQKVAPKSNTSTERSRHFLARHRAALRQSVSRCGHGFSTLTHHILRYHRLCHAMAKGRLFVFLL